MADPAVSETDFRDILDSTRQFIRSVVMLREREIMTDNRVPDDIRDQAKKMGLFGYAIPQEWGGLGLNLTKAEYQQVAFNAPLQGLESDPVAIRTYNAFRGAPRTYGVTLRVKY